MKANKIGNKIAKARKEQNMSQAQLAQLLFISPQAVGKWERGESFPDIATLDRLAEILNVDLNYFSENLQSSESTPISKVINDTNVQEQKEFKEVDASDRPERPLLINFSGSALAKTDLAGVSLVNRRFVGSDLRDSDFSNADLTGSVFKGSDVRETNFTGANLTDCTFSALDLSNASFIKATLVRTEFSASELSGVKFMDAELVDVKLARSDLRKMTFIDCIFNGVDFKYSDLSGLCLDGHIFMDVNFSNAALNKVSFKGAVFRNVSFRPTFALTNRYYKTLQTICFDGAVMDKLTYAALKGVGVDLSKVTTI